MMSQPRPFQMVGGKTPGQYNDTIFTKVFVGGLAWETKRDAMRRYFEQFGEIVEVVVITDKNTGRSKGYGFVTFKDPEAAMRACQNPSPVIDGRRANCNLASLGASKAYPPIPQHGVVRYRPAAGLGAPPAYHGSSSFFHQSTGHYSFPYSAYGYSGYSQDTMFPMNYYSFYGGGGQQFSPYSISVGVSGQPGMIPSFYPYYSPHVQNSQSTHGFGIQYPQMMQSLYLPQHYGSAGILSLPSSIAMPSAIPGATVTETTSVTTAVAESGVVGVGLNASQPSATTPEQVSSK